MRIRLKRRTARCWPRRRWRRRWGWTSICAGRGRTGKVGNEAMYSSDAYRAIELAPRFARILGWACAILGTIGVGLVVADVDGRIPNGLRVVAAATVALIMIVPGILYVGFADAMRRRRKW